MEMTIHSQNLMHPMDPSHRLSARCRLYGEAESSGRKSVIHLEKLESCFAVISMGITLFRVVPNHWIAKP